MTPDRLATLARAMGYTVTLDDSGGYGVVRVLFDHDIGGLRLRSVFCPHQDAAQAFEVLAWLMKEDLCARIECDTVFFDDGDQDYERPLLREDHDGTPEGIRNAIVEAAARVAESIKPIRHPRGTALAQDATCGMLEVRNG